MKVILDEGVPRQLVKALRDAGLDAHRFRNDWRQIGNGDLIRAVEAEGFAVLVTNDKNMADQQTLAGMGLAVVALPLNRRRSIMERVPDIADTIRRSCPGQHVVIAFDGSRFARSVVEGATVLEQWPPVPSFES